MWAALLHTYWDWVSMLMLMLLELREERGNGDTISIFAHNSV